MAISRQNRIFMERITSAQAELLAFAAALLPYNGDDVEDVVQEVNLALIEKAENYDTGRPFRAWMFAIAKRKIADVLRHKYRNRVVYDSELVGIIAEKLATDPAAQAGNDGILRRLAQCRQRLSARHKRMLELRYDEDLSIPQIALRLEQSVRSVHDAMFYIRRKLADCIRRTCKIGNEEASALSPRLEQLLGELLDGETQPRNRAEELSAEIRATGAAEECFDQLFVHALLRRRSRKAFAGRKLHAGKFAKAAAMGAVLAGAAYALFVALPSSNAVQTKANRVQTQKETTMNTAKTLGGILAAALAASAADTPREWIVDKNGVESEFTTIQAAIDAASEGDVVTVLPGEYGTGETLSVNSYNRVVINKNITVRSRDGKEVTHIVGRLSQSSTGLGEDAVRCVQFLGPGRLEGFTLRNGASRTDNDGSDASLQNKGGGVNVLRANGSNSATKNTDSVVVDCVISNCVATRGGGMFSGLAVRTLFDNNAATVNGAAARYSVLFNCVVVRSHAAGSLEADGNKTSSALAYGSAINTTFANNLGSAVSNASKSQGLGVLNCILVNNMYTSDNSSQNSANIISNSVVKAFSGQYGGENALNGSELPQIVNNIQPDLRLVAGSLAEGIGNPEYLKLVPEEFRSTDFHGKPRIVDGKLSAGASSEIVETFGDIYSFSGQTAWKYINGYQILCDGVHVCHTVWPTQYLFKAEAKDKALRRVRNFSLGSTDVAPRSDDCAWMLPPQNQTVTWDVGTGLLYYASPTGSADAEGTEDDPLTLQAAIDKAGSGGIVVALPGEYNTGSTVGGGHNNRVLLSYPSQRIVSRDGAASTIITGQADPDTGACGPNAIRCVCFKTTGACHLQGFTLRNGYTSSTESDADEPCLRGGGAYGNGNNNRLLDCIIENCTASRGAAQFYVALERCFVRNCKATNNGILRGALIRQCVIDGSQAGGNDHIGNGAILQGCTVVNDKGSNAAATLAAGSQSAANTIIYNTVSTKGDFGAGASATNLLYGTRSGSSNGSLALNVVQGDPFFAGENDLHVAPNSPAIGLADRSVSGGWYCSMDIEGNPWRVDANGKMTAGAYQTPYESANFYVDCNNTGDADGSASSPFPTIQEAIDAARHGDVIIVAPGEYKTGETLSPTRSNQAVATYIKSRVVIDKAVTLKSSHGAEKTFIIGAEASSPDQYGCGADAVRCVWIGSSRVVIEGFTICGGRVESPTTLSEDKNDNCQGGGVCAYGHNDAQINSCIISNNVAPRGGGARYGVYTNCKFLENTATVNGSGLRDGYAYQCLFAKNKGPVVCSFVSVMEHCTVAADNTTLAGSVPQAFGSNTNEKQGLRNSILALTSTGSGGIYRNCLFPAGYAPGNATEVAACVSGAIDLDANYAPLATSAAVDAANTEYAANYQTDLAGNQRVWNNAPDIGCFERDFRRDYAAKLVNLAAFSVESATPNAQLQDDGVVIYNGDISAAWTQTGTGGSLLLNWKVLGDGVLTIFENDTAIVNSTSADGAASYKLIPKSNVSNLRFSYQASGDGDSGAKLLPFKNLNGTVVMLI